MIGATPMPSATIPGRALFLLVAMTLVWGTNWPLFVFATAEISVWTFRTISMAGAAFALFVIARAMRLPLSIPRRHWRDVFLAALLYLLVWNIASTLSALRLPSGQSAVLGFTMPLWSALLSWLLLREPMRPRLQVAIALGVASVALLMAPNFRSYAEAPSGMVLGLAAGLGWACGTLVLKRGRVDVPSPVLSAWQMAIAAVPIAIVAWFVGDHRWFVPSTASMVAIAYIALVPMTIGTVCWFAIVGLLPTNVAALSPIMVPIVAMVSGAIVHGEPLGPVQCVAMACSATALWLSLYRPA